LGRTIKDLQYKGNFDFDVSVVHGTAQTKLNGKGNISQKDIDIILDTNMEGEKVHAEADVKNYMQSPDATINISSKSLNIDKLLAMVAGMPESTSGKTQKSKPKKSNDIIADSLPPGLVANGTVKVDKAVYKKITTNDFTLLFNLSKGILTVKELSAKAYSGKLDSKLTVDLNQPGLAYKGNLGLQSVQAADLSTALIQKAANMLTGSFQTAMNFSGAGTSWSEIKKVLSADGSFTLADGGIKGTPVSSSISTLLGLQELNNISYKNISGTFKIVEGGKVKIKSNLQGADLNAEAEGIIGLDGSLDLPVTLHLSPALADKLKSRTSFAKYLTDEQGGSTLHLKLTGNLKSPKPTLDMKGAQEQIQKSIQKEVFKQLDGSSQETDKKESPENLIKGLFGK
jgi:AsmA protein